MYMLRLCICYHVHSSRWPSGGRGAAAQLPLMTQMVMMIQWQLHNGSGSGSDGSERYGLRSHDSVVQTHSTERQQLWTCVTAQSRGAVQPAPVLDGHVVLLQVQPGEAWEPAHGVDQGVLRQVDAAAQVQVPQRR